RRLKLSRERATRWTLLGGDARDALILVRANGVGYSHAESKFQFGTQSSHLSASPVRVFQPRRCRWSSAGRGGKPRRSLLLRRSASAKSWGRQFQNRRRHEGVRLLPAAWSCRVPGPAKSLR